MNTIKSFSNELIPVFEDIEVSGGTMTINAPNLDFYVYIEIDDLEGLRQVINDLSSVLDKLSQAATIAEVESLKEY